MSHKVAIVIPVHNGKAELLRCLASLVEVTYSDLTCTVVDDGSTDGTAQVLAELHPWVRVLTGDGNLWWSGATNLGLQDALMHGADYILLLNHDTVVAPDLVAKLVTCSSAHPGAVIGARVMFLEEPDRIWAAGGGANWWNGGLHHLQFGESGAVDGREQEVLWFPGMGTLIPGAVFAKVGTYDERRFPQYYGDADFCFRARAQGVPLIYCPQAVIWNEVKNSGLSRERMNLSYVWRSLSSRRSSRNVTDTFRFYGRYCPGPQLPFCLGTIYLNHFRSLARRWLNQIKSDRGAT